MPRVLRKMLIEAHPDDVFQALTTPADRARWVTTMVEESGASSLSAGSRILAKRRDPSSRSRYEITVRTLDRPRRLETEVHRNGAAAGRAGYLLTPEGTGTRVEGWAEFELSGLTRLMAPLVTANLEKGLEADLASLKRHVESKPEPMT